MRARAATEAGDAVQSEIDRMARAALAGSTDRAEQSRTLPPAAYASEAFYALEIEKIFKKDWLCVGHISQVAKTGDYFSIDLFGEPLVVVRGPDRIRVLSRVCLHRWAPVVAGAGNAKILSCPFHKWGYALDGQLLGAPFMEQAEGFDPKSCRLPEFRSEVVERLGLIFMTFSDTVASIGDRLGDLCDYLGETGMDQMVVVRTTETVNDYNWKILIETFMECYHHIGAHRETLEPDNPARLSYCEESRTGWTVCHSPLREDFLAEESDGEKRAFSLYNIYPSLIFGGPMDRSKPAERRGFTIVIPLGPSRVLTKRHTLVTREAAELPETFEKLDKNKERFAKVNAEDNAVNDMQQIGALSAYAEQGRLSHLENTVWHLAEYVRSQIRTN